VLPSLVNKDDYKHHIRLTESVYCHISAGRTGCHSIDRWSDAIWRRTILRTTWVVWTWLLAVRARPTNDVALKPCSEIRHDDCTSAYECAASYIRGTAYDKQV